MGEKIKRYDLTHDELWPRSNGDWVKYEDVAHIQAENMDLKGRVNKFHVKRVEALEARVTELEEQRDSFQRDCIAKGLRVAELESQLSEATRRDRP